MKMIFLIALALFSCATTKSHYTSEIVAERIVLPQEENDEMFFFEQVKGYLYIHRSDGSTWNIDIDYPLSMNFEPTLHETKEGFLLDFGKDDHRFFFKEIKQEPHLVKIGAKEIQPINIKSLSEISFLIENTFKQK